VLIMMPLHKHGMNGKNAITRCAITKVTLFVVLPNRNAHTHTLFSGIEILPLLVRVLERPFQRIEQAVYMALQEKTNIPGSLERAVATAVTRDQKLAVQKATKVLAMYSLVPEAKQPMCDCKGMLHCLTRIIDTHYYNRIKPGAPVIGGAASKASDRVLRGVDGGDASTLSGTDGGESQAKLEQAKRLEIAASATSGAGLYMT